MTLVCVGNSHLVALSKGAALLGMPLIEIRLKEIKKAGKTAEIDAEIRQALGKGAAKRLFCLIGGGTPAVLGLVQHPRRFDFLMPGRVELGVSEEAELIPYSAMRALMEGMVRRHFRLLRRLGELPVPLAQIESPPPIFDGDYLIDVAAKSLPEIKTHGPSSPMLRYKIWALHSALFERFCGKHGILYVKNPPEVMDEMGFLKPAYWGDFVHGNAQYGAAVLRRLEAYG
jgi:hypothetical protein